MAFNSFPDFNELLTVNFNAQLLHDTLLEMKLKIEELENRIIELENENGS